MESVCTESPSGFDPLTSAASYSQLAGVIAAVLFTGVVLLIGSRPGPAAESHRRSALHVVVPALFTAIVSCFILGLVSSEQVCRRGASEATIAGCLLAILGLATFQAIAWMLKSYEGDHDSLELPAALCRFAIAFIAIGQVALSLSDMQTQFRESKYVTALVQAFLVVGWWVVALIAFRWWRRRRLPTISVSWSGYVLVGYSLVSVALFDIASDSAPALWSSSPPWIMELIIGVIAVIFLPCTVVLLLAAPARNEPQGGNVVASDPAARSANGVDSSRVDPTLLRRMSRAAVPRKSTQRSNGC